MDGWMDGLMDKWMDRQIDRQIDRIVNLGYINDQNKVKKIDKIHRQIELIYDIQIDRVDRMVNLDGCHNQDKDNGQHADLLPEGVDGRHPVQQHDEQEVQVGEPEQQQCKHGGGA